jgi:hypothetical protein
MHVRCLDTRRVRRCEYQNHYDGVTRGATLMFPTIMNRPQWEQRKKDAPTSFSSTTKASAAVC